MGDGWHKTRSFLTSRLFVKGAFFAFFVFAVVQLLRYKAWARGEGPYVHRPEAVAGLLPIGHYTSFFAWLKGGGWDVFLPAGLIIILAALAVSLLLKRGFCGWVCPLGTMWEGAAWTGRQIFGKNVRLPRWLDIVGRGFRYLIMSAILAFLISVPVQAAVEFRTLPYMWIADLRMLHVFAEPLYIAVFALGFAVSIAFGPVWCRYLCPLGGLYSIVGLASPCTIERDAEACIHCHKCSEVCHALVEPEKTTRVWAAECDGCMDCAKACPVDGCLEAKALSRVRIAPWVWPLLVVALWLGIWGFAKATGNWDATVGDDNLRAIINSGIIEQGAGPR